MPALSRREFLSTAAVSLRKAEPETILHHANIFTVDPRQPRAEAVAIAGGRFLAAGSNVDIRALAKPGTRQIDLEGKTVVPGFVDAHSHPASAGRAHLREVDCDLRSIRAIQEAIRRRAAKTPAGQWVLGFKYDDTKTEEGRKLTREDLDASTTQHPVFIQHRGGHTAYVNSLAFRAAGVPETVADPPGGKFDRDAAGRLTGGLRERATEPFHKVIPSYFSRADYREGVKLISQMLVKTGITSVHDAYGTP